MRLKGTGAATNSKLSDYRVELAEHHTMQQVGVLTPRGPYRDTIVIPDCAAALAVQLAKHHRFATTWWTDIHGVRFCRWVWLVAISEFMLPALNCACKCMFDLQALQGEGDSRSQALVAAPCTHFERWVKVGSEALGLPVAPEAWEQAVVETDAAVTGAGVAKDVTD